MNYERSAFVNGLQRDLTEGVSSLSGVATSPSSPLQG
jgi:hypothetical protein